MTHSTAIDTRIDQVAQEAASARAATTPPTDSDPDMARTIARKGLWPVLRIYIDARRDGHHFSRGAHEQLEQALNDWLTAYAAAYGYDTDPGVPVREAGETFLDTHNLFSTAQILTGVPPRQ